MRDCYRPLIIFAPAASDTRLARQLAELSQHAADLRERNILVVINPADDQLVAAGEEPGLPAIQLSPDENRRLRERFQVSNQSFTVLLVGKDGGEKMRKHDIVTVETLNHKVDGMPMRQAEQKRSASPR